VTDWTGLDGVVQAVRVCGVVTRQSVTVSRHSSLSVYPTV